MQERQHEEIPAAPSREHHSPPLQGAAFTMGIRACLGRGAGRAGSRDAPPQPLPWISEASFPRVGLEGVLLRSARRMLRTKEVAGRGGGDSPRPSLSATNNRGGGGPRTLAPGSRLSSASAPGGLGG